MESSKKLTREELRQMAEESTNVEGQLDEEAGEAAKLILDILEGDDETASTAALQVAIAMADGLLQEYEDDLAGGRWTSYLIRSLGDGRLPDGTVVEPATIIYVGRTRNLEEREKTHRIAASSQSHRGRSMIAQAIYELRHQNVDVWFQPVNTDMSLEDAKRSEAALVRALLKTGSPLQNRQLVKDQEESPPC